MAFNTQLSNVFVDAQANTVAAFFNDGYLTIYSGTQPTTADDPPSGSALVTLKFANPAFQPASNGIITAYPLSTNVAVSAGTASWFRTYESDGTTVLLDGTVGDKTGNNLVLGTTVISVGSVVSVTGFTHTVAKSTPGS